MKFIGRKDEISAIQSILFSRRATIGIIYGRRRIGKTLLITESMKEVEYCYFEGLENRTKQEQIKHFIFQLKTYFNEITSISEISSWKEIFLSLYELTKDNPKSIVFDEFQWMANYRQEIISDLKFVWDRYFSKVEGITLILCGSIASFMITKVMKSNALYGRIDLEINLRSFNINETKQMLSDKNITECIESHLFTGGIPKYLELLKETESVRLGMELLAFRNTGYFFKEYDRIFTSHFGRNPEYERIIKILVMHPDGLFRKDISEFAKKPPGGQLTDYLNTLESAGFITSYIPFNKTDNSRHIKYFVSDAFIRFYWAFIQPNKRKIVNKSSDAFFAGIVQTGKFYSWMGKSFEYFCIQHAVFIAKQLGFSGIEYSYGPYFKPPEKKNKTKGVQIDLLFDRSDNVISLCEIKYLKNTIGLSVIEDVEKKAMFLRKAAGNKTMQRILITRSPPSKELINSGYFYKILTIEDFMLQ